MGAVGRPTKYDPSMVVKAKEYMDSCGREQTELPTIEGLALVLGLDDEQISIYAQEHPEFSATVKELKSKQKNQLVNDGLYGGKEVNPTMAIFLLKVNHAMVETEKKLIGNLEGGKLEPLVIIKDGSQT